MMTSRGIMEGCTIKTVGHVLYLITAKFSLELASLFAGEFM